MKKFALEVKNCLLNKNKTFNDEKKDNLISSKLMKVILKRNSSKETKNIFLKMFGLVPSKQYF